MASSSGRRCRLLEVKIKSASLNTKKKGLFYVKLWIDQESKLQTERVYCSEEGSNPVWNKRFVFTVPHTFVADKKPSVWFEIFRARKGFRDSSIGKAEGKLELEKNCNDNDNNAGDRDAKYDTANENSEDEVDEDDRIEEEEEERKDLSELKGSASLRVEKGLDEKGELNVEMVVWKGYLARVGNCRWMHWAMDYDEFMGLKEVDRKKKKKNKKYHLWMCFANKGTND